MGSAVLHFGSGERWGDDSLLMLLTRPYLLPIFRLPATRGSWLWVAVLGLLLSAAPAAQAQRSKKKSTKTSTRRQPRPKSKAQLERERRANLQKIKQASRELDQTQAKKKVSIGQLNALKEKLVVKKTVISNISTQLKTIETGVQETTQEVVKTQQTLAELKEEYARLLYLASKTANSYNRLMFLFAADSFNEFALRLRYVRQYTEERQKQADRIIAAQRRLNQQLTGLARQQQRQSTLLSAQLSEKQNLLALKDKEDQMVQQLSQQEQGLRAELNRRQQAVRRLDNLIAQRVREEIERAARAARLAARRAAAAKAARESRSSSANPTADAPETAAEAAADRRASRVTLTPETALLAKSFAGNKGRLPWPVSRGFISQHFGRHAHPVLRNVVVENRGVDIQTNAGESVRACFEGKVLTVNSIPGMGNIVMIQHGDYFTVYAKLDKVSVRENQTVSAREVIGTVAANPEGASEVQFQVWHNSSNQNPESWLGRK